MGKEDKNKQEAKDKLITVVDIGTEAIKVLIGGRASNSEPDEKPPLCIYGIGRSLSNSPDTDNMPIDIRKGEIINVDKVQKRIEEALKEAGESSGMDVQETEIYVNISGQHLRAENVESTIAIPDRQVTEEDQIRIIKIAREKCLTELQGTTLQCCTRYFSTEQGITYDVLNRVTRNLHAYIQAAVCTSQQKLATIRLMMKNATGMPEITPLYTPMLLGCAGMDNLQREKHSLSIDIGAGLTSFSINTPAGMMDFGHIPIGCNHLENDLMLGLDIDWEAARHLVHNLSRITEAAKDEFGAKTVCLKHKGGLREKDVPIESIMAIVNARLEEIFQLVRNELKNRGSWDDIFGKAFISGGGALLPTICETAAHILELETDIARPGTDIIANTSNKEFISDPRWIVPIGMLKMAVIDYEIRTSVKDSKGHSGNVAKLLHDVIQIIINW